MEKITDISKLPDWFHKRTYRKQLSDIDWYREIRLRQSLLSLIEMWGEPNIKIPEESRNSLLERLKNDDVRPDSMIYCVSQEAIPISELTVGETTFLAFSTRRSNASEIVKKYEQLLELWIDAIDEMKAAGDDGPTPTLGQYETELAAFVDQFDDIESIFESDIGQYYARLENPLLSYGRPLNGHPLTIDTQFDDETILRHVKEWLIETRKKEGSKARRPFNQNDFDDWEYYKIRESLICKYGLPLMTQRY